jgi:hypothetical protein
MRMLVRHADTYDCHLCAKGYNAINLYDMANGWVSNVSAAAEAAPALLRGRLPGAWAGGWLVLLESQNKGRCLHQRDWSRAVVSHPRL